MSDLYKSAISGHLKRGPRPTLRDLRKKGGLTLGAAARALGVSPVDVSECERDHETARALNKRGAMARHVEDMERANDAMAQTILKLLNELKPVLERMDRRLRKRVNAKVTIRRNWT